MSECLFVAQQGATILLRSRPLRVIFILVTYVLPEVQPYLAPFRRE